MATSKPEIIVQLFRKLPDIVQNIIKSYNIFHLFPLYLKQNSMLWEKGWFLSRKKGVPVNADGNPMPWYTYSAIDFLDSRVEPEHQVFEYGGGNSTIWYAQRVDTVVSVEDTKDWVEIIRQYLPDNGHIIYQPSKNAYVKEILEHDTFDIIVIDGSHRVECVEPSLEALSGDGVVIWDDFERLDEDDYRIFRENGFSILPLRGLNSYGVNYKCTAVLYRDKNCLDI